MRTRGRTAIAIAATTLLAQCGGSPDAPSGPDPVVTISASGVSPVEVRVALGGRVTFTNKDERPHAMSSDPVQVHTDCPAINDVGFLNPGQSRSTGILTVARTCGFHDHTNETDPTWKGRIIVQ
jgi:plastocyanin